MLSVLAPVVDDNGEVTSMPHTTTTPPTFVLFAIGGGLLFILGGILTTMSSNARIALLATAVAFLALGVYTLTVINKANRLGKELDEATGDLERRRSAAAGLRARMAYTLREPLTGIVGFADRLANEPDLEEAQRIEMALAIREGAREVEQVLADLAAEGDHLTTPLSRGVVLLHDEVKSVIGTVPYDTTFETDLAEARAWADSAHVRQILRTIINAARDHGVTEITVHTEERPDRAVVTISVRGALLPPDAVATLTGEAADDSAGQNQRSATLAAAHESAVAMGGSIGFADVFGRSHIVVELPLHRSDVGVQHPVERPRRDQPVADAPRNLAYHHASELRPERPTASIRFV
jgi:hypothetical protein